MNPGPFDIGPCECCPGAAPTTCEQCRDTITALTATIAGYEECTFTDLQTQAVHHSVLNTYNGGYYADEPFPIDINTTSFIKRHGILLDPSNRGKLLRTITYPNGDIVSSYAWATYVEYSCGFGLGADRCLMFTIPLIHHHSSVTGAMTDQGFSGLTNPYWPGTGMSGLWAEICAGGTMSITENNRFQVYCDHKFASVTHTYGIVRA